jgi:tRNA G10  N-methylase Trm11
MVATIPHQANLLSGSLVNNWQGAASTTEISLHQLSPYIGKIKSSMAASLISQLTSEGSTVCDPFAGSGTVALEAWIAGRHAIANDLNPYAFLLTKAKLFPYRRLEDALIDVEVVSIQAQRINRQIDLRSVPKWVRSFFDNETLREIMAWTQILRNSRRHFLLACLMGILHHQRPGFLSYPSSHTVPYLRTKQFPPAEYPDLYRYRDLRSRLDAKVKRALKRFPELNFSLERDCCSKDASRFAPDRKVDTIITSPPYMRSLDYARDNRLRLWFLGTTDWRSIEMTVSPRELAFIALMRRCFKLWRTVLSRTGHCVVVSGDRFCRSYQAPIPDVITRIATKEVGGFELTAKYKEEIPNARRVRRGLEGNLYETILVLRRKEGKKIWQNS